MGGRGRSSGHQGKEPGASLRGNVTGAWWTGSGPHCAGRSADAGLRVRAGSCRPFCGYGGHRAGNGLGPLQTVPSLRGRPQFPLLGLQALCEHHGPPPLPQRVVDPGPPPPPPGNGAKVKPPRASGPQTWPWPHPFLEERQVLAWEGRGQVTRRGSREGGGSSPVSVGLFNPTPFAVRRLSRKEEKGEGGLGLRPAPKKTPDLSPSCRPVVRGAFVRREAAAWNPEP